LTGTKARYYTVSGGDALTDKGLAHVFPWAAEDRPSHWMTDDIAADFEVLAG
jgi:hypothetical protein